MMANKNIEDVSFEGKHFNPAIEQIKISDEEKEKLNDIFDLIEYVHDSIASDTDKQSAKIAKKIYKETHLYSVPFVKKAVEENLNSDIFADWVMKFFSATDGASASNEYNLGLKQVQRKVKKL